MKSFIDVTEEGILISFNKAHLLKAFLPINLTDCGIIIAVNSEQLSNVPFSIEDIDEGIDMLSIEEQPEKAFSPIDWIEELIAISFWDVVFGIALSPFEAENSIFLSFLHPWKTLLLIAFIKEGKVMYLIAQFWNAYSSIVSIDSGISIFTRLVHFSNVPCLMTFTEDGISICRNDVQLLKAYESISVTVIFNFQMPEIQFSNARDPIFVTNGVIFNSINDLHPQKVFLPIFIFLWLRSILTISWSLISAAIRIGVWWNLYKTWFKLY